MNQEQHKFTVGSSVLSGILEKPVSAELATIILHPHPLYGGDMFNPVVTTLAETIQESGLATLRFNFRGVNSRSEYAGILGAVDDVITASELLENQGLKLAGVAGYSFGGSTALRFSSCTSVDFVVSVSSSLDLFKEGEYPATHLSKITCPVLMLHGTSDLTVPYNNILQISSHIQGTVSSVAIENEGHFYHGSLSKLRDEVKGFMKIQGFLESS
ncbi:MAG: dienelactone hydrolase family protein [Candidatus Thorarchaeota archaeon]